MSGKMKLTEVVTGVIMHRHSIQHAGRIACAAGIALGQAPMSMKIRWEHAHCVPAQCPPMVHNALRIKVLIVFQLNFACLLI